MEVTDYNIYVKEYTQSIYRFVYKLLDSKDAAKDIVQDAYLKLWENGQSLDKSSVKSWLYTTAYRLSINYLKIANRNVSDEVLQVVVGNDSINCDVKKIINDSLSLLSEFQKSCVMLKDYEGYSYIEIAEILSITEESVKVHLFRGRQKIKNYIRDIKILI